MLEYRCVSTTQLNSKADKGVVIHVDANFLFGIKIINCNILPCPQPSRCSCGECYVAKQSIPRHHVVNYFYTITCPTRRRNVVPWQSRGSAYKKIRMVVSIWQYGIDLRRRHFPHTFMVARRTAPTAHPSWSKDFVSKWQYVVFGKKKLMVSILLRNKVDFVLLWHTVEKQFC